ncbi:hypothetical protein D3C71_988060 [compost metagenome]
MSAGLAVLKFLYAVVESDGVWCCLDSLHAVRENVVTIRIGSHFLFIMRPMI